MKNLVYFVMVYFEKKVKIHLKYVLENGLKHNTKNHKNLKKNSKVVQVNTFWVSKAKIR